MTHLTCAYVNQAPDVNYDDNDNFHDKGDVNEARNTKKLIL